MEGRQRLGGGRGVGCGVEDEEGKGEGQAGYGGVAKQRQARVACAALVAACTAERVQGGQSVHRSVLSKVLRRALHLADTPVKESVDRRGCIELLEQTKNDFGSKFEVANTCHLKHTADAFDEGGG